MGFWESFRNEYQAARHADAVCEIGVHGTHPPPRDDSAVHAECERLSALLGEREEKLAESNALISELAAEVEKLSQELKIRRRAEPQGTGYEKYKKLRRIVVRCVHPDKAGDDKHVASVLERICKELNAEIDRIDAA